MSLPMERVSISAKGSSPVHSCIRKDLEMDYLALGPDLLNSDITHGVYISKLFVYDITKGVLEYQYMKKARCYCEPHAPTS